MPSEWHVVPPFLIVGILSILIREKNDDTCTIYLLFEKKMLPTKISRPLMYFNVI